MRRRRQSESGQGATEYMLVIAVCVVAIVAAAYTFVPQFRGGVESLSTDVNQMLSTGDMKALGGFNRNAADSFAVANDKAPMPPGDGMGGSSYLPGDHTVTANSYRNNPGTFKVMVPGAQPATQ